VRSFGFGSVRGVWACVRGTEEHGVERGGSAGEDGEILKAAAQNVTYITEFCRISEKSGKNPFFSEFPLPNL
jgi:hypothetical protein